MSKKALKQVKKQFKSAVLETHSALGDDTVILAREALRDVALFLRDDPELRFEMLIDVTIVDYLGARPPELPRFEAVYHFLSLTHRHRLRLKVPLEADDPQLASISDIYPASDWAERECFDMYGVRFTGHPDLRRILLYEEFEGYPLRKDYGLLHSQPRVDLLEIERPTTNQYPPNYGEYGPEKENR